MIRLVGQQDEFRLGCQHFLQGHPWIAGVSLARRLGLRQSQVSFQRITAPPIGKNIGAAEKLQEIARISVPVESHPPGLAVEA